LLLVFVVLALLVVLLFVGLATAVAGPFHERLALAALDPARGRAPRRGSGARAGRLASRARPDLHRALPAPWA
jgi:hypothetical protein